MRPEPRPQRSFIDRQGFPIVKMAAWVPVRRAAGMKNDGARLVRQAGKLQFFKPGRRDCRNPGPVSDGRRQEAAGFANPAICRVPLELKREQLERKFVERRIFPEAQARQTLDRGWMRGAGSWESQIKGLASLVLRSQQPAQSRSEV